MLIKYEKQRDANFGRGVDLTEVQFKFSPGNERPAVVAFDRHGPLEHRAHTSVL